MYKSQCVPERIEQSVEKLKFVIEYLDWCEMHQQGNSASLQGVALVLADIEQDLEVVGQLASHSARAVNHAQ